MAGIELNNMLNTPTNRMAEVSSNAPAQESIRRTSEITSGEKATETEKQPDTKEAMKKAAEAREAALENVVARSEDGDTVQVSEDGETELSESTEGNVRAESSDDAAKPTLREDNFEVKAEEDQERAAEIAERAAENAKKAQEAAEKAAEIARETIEATQEKAAQEEAEAAEDKVVVNGPPFPGYTEQQLETMYLQGDISRADFTTEESRREEIKESVAEENSSVNEDMAQVTAAGRRAQQVDFAIETALESESEIDIETRLAAVSENEKNQSRMAEEAGKLWDYQLRA
ncbi:MAG: hypothetical protein K5853_08550 [Lachnospiraceae bacterium]|nr:hypothetical protein [Lachnospiraceae bacterium]